MEQSIRNEIPGNVKEIISDKVLSEVILETAIGDVAAGQACECPAPNFRYIFLDITIVFAKSGSWKWVAGMFSKSRSESASDMVGRSIPALITRYDTRSMHGVAQSL